MSRTIKGDKGECLVSESGRNHRWIVMKVNPKKVGFGHTSIVGNKATEKEAVALANEIVGN